MEDAVLRTQPTVGTLLARIVRSSLGLKYVMAISGLALVLFNVGHMAGHLQMFQGQKVYNHYAETLQGMGAIKWGVRFALLALLVLHIWAAIVLTKRNSQARNAKYAVVNSPASTYAARTMRWSGVIVLVFLVYHLAHFTLGYVDTTSFSLTTTDGGKQIHDVYNMVVRSFSDWRVSVPYIIAQILLGFHLSHGISSMFQSVGAISPQYRGFISKLGPLGAALIVLGYISVPIAVLAGVLQLAV